MTRLGFGVGVVHQGWPTLGLIEAAQLNGPERKRFGWVQRGPAQIGEVVIGLTKRPPRWSNRKIEGAEPIGAEIKPLLCKQRRLHRQGAPWVRRGRA